MVKSADQDEPLQSLPEEVPVCSKMYDIVLGDSLLGNKTKNYSFRYAFIPRSVENQRWGEAEIKETSVLLTHASKDYDSQTHFRGKKSAAKDDDFILVFRNGKFYLEKLHVKVTNLKHYDRPKLDATRQPSRPTFQRANMLGRTSMFKHPPASRLAGVRGETKVLEPPKKRSGLKKRLEKRPTSSRPPTSTATAKRGLPGKHRARSKLPKRRTEVPAPRLPKQHVPSRSDFERNIHIKRSNIGRTKAGKSESSNQSEVPSQPVGFDGRSAPSERSDGEDEELVDQSALFSSDSEDD